jgi:hypothetical protein
MPHGTIRAATLKTIIPLVMEHCFAMKCGKLMVANNGNPRKRRHRLPLRRLCGSNPFMHHFTNPVNVYDIRGCLASYIKRGFLINW